MTAAINQANSQKNGVRPINPMVPFPDNKMDDDDEDPGHDEIFPSVGVGLGITVQLVTIGPALAEEWLGRQTDRQRGIKRQHLKALELDLREGRWRLNGETIVFDYNGRLLDGQHRLTAVLNTGVTVQSLVVRGVHPAHYDSIDITAKRTSGDMLRVSQVDYAVAVGAAALLLYRYELGLIGRDQVSLSPIAIHKIVDAHPGLAAGAATAMRAKSVCKSGAASTFCYYLFRTLDPAQADAFWDKLVSGADLHVNHPVLRFRTCLTNNKLNADQTVHLLIKAWNAYRQGREVKQLRINNEECPTAI